MRQCLPQWFDLVTAATFLAAASQSLHGSLHSRSPTIPRLLFAFSIIRHVRHSSVAPIASHTAAAAAASAVATTAAAYATAVAPSSASLTHSPSPVTSAIRPLALPLPPLPPRLPS
jgi:hypothetical protein